MHVMVDIESLSTEHNANIISIGAVGFDAIKIHGTFSRNIVIQKDRHISDSTIIWWMKQSEAVRQVFEKDTVPIKAALEDFGWYLKQINNLEGVWGNGSDFDNVILADAYKQYGIPQPWSHLQNRCYRTLKNMKPDLKLERLGEHHNSLHDAVSQATHAIELIKALGLQAAF